MIMNPASTNGPDLQLPAPLNPNQPLPAINQPGTVPLPQIPATNSQAPAQTAVPSTTSIVVPAVAEDQDLIEKDWVAKAKHIVEKTRDNPYQQSQELTVFKSDYMQKRYNKTIKPSE
jgi:hypothetical protein